MKKRYCLIRRKDRQGTFYLHDLVTGKRESLGTKTLEDAEQIINAKNEALRQPHINLQIAKAFLFGADDKIKTRTWDNIFDAIIETRHGSTQERWKRAKAEAAFDLIRNKLLIETTAEDFLAVLKAGTVSTNVHLRKVHNFALDMDWLPKVIIPKCQWPAIVYREKRAITVEEHQKIVAVERNPERKAFYQLCWYLGGAQGDIASLRAEDIDWNERTLAYARHKTRSPAIIHLGAEVLEILKDLPSEGLLFPQFSTLSAGHRATEFRRKCAQARINSEALSLHSYRYAWAERAKKAGYPERFAMGALGHGSKAVARAYAKKAQVKLPSLEDYENALKENSKTRTLKL